MLTSATEVKLKKNLRNVEFKIIYVKGFTFLILVKQNPENLPALQW